jgi:formate transporter
VLQINLNKELAMAYLAPSEFVTKMVDAGEAKFFMSARDTEIGAFMAGAILALAAWFAVTINVQTGQSLAGAILFPVGFSMLYLLGFDLLTGVFRPCTPCAVRQKTRCHHGRRAAQLDPRLRR